MVAAPTSTPILLTSKQMAAFVARGFLRLDEVIPPEVCAAALHEIEAGLRPSQFGARDAGGRPAGRRLDDVWPDDSGMAAVMRLPAVAGVVQSLVGPAPLYDHHYAHTIEAGQRWSQPWHADAIIDPRLEAFDIQLFFFPHDTPREMGGTMILPGSHLRRVNESDIARYHNIVGQLPMVCKGGSLLVCHHGIWHCGQPNLTRKRRHMWKLRLNPAVVQRRLWDLADVADPAVSEILNRPEPWHGNEARLEVVNRIRLWRHLTGDARFDIDLWLTRFETPPQ
jgi:hypothetical protein